jgi:hypothetical protein
MATHCDHVTNMSISSQHVSIVESRHFDARLAPPVQAATAHLRTRSGWISPEDHGDPDYLAHSPIRSSLRDRGKDWRTRLPMPLDPAAGLMALTDPRRCSMFVPMEEVETLGIARSLGWKVHMRCAKGYREGTKSIRRRVYCKQLDTSVCTRGPNFPLSRLDSRLMCPACGSHTVTVVFEPPTNRAVLSG